jgi:hypothetical protein
VASEKKEWRGEKKGRRTTPSARPSVAPQVLALDARKHADVLVGDEPPGDERPALVALELVVGIPLWGEGLDRGQPGPGDVGEVVVLVVVADVVSEQVERTVVRVGLLLVALFEGIVLG